MQPQQPTNQTVTPSKKVLVIEDENFISDLYVRALKVGGYDPTVVIDGSEALKEAQKNIYDIVLLDIMLPSVTGTEILTTLRNPQLTPNLKSKIIITTNLELDPEGRAVIENQADGYIIKADITPKELVKFLDQLQLN